MIASATAIRKAVKAGQEIKGYVPESVRNDLLDQTIDWEFLAIVAVPTYRNPS